MEEVIDKNWASEENQKSARDYAVRALEKMKELEKNFSKTRRVVVEETSNGKRFKYQQDN